MAKVIQIVFLLAPLYSTVLSQGVLQEFSAFDNVACIPSEPFGMYGRYNADLRYYGQNDNLAVAVNGIGNWIFYDNAVYTGDSEPVVLRQRGTCVRLQIVASRASSVKFAGDPNDYRLPSITIYQGNNYQGREIYIAGDSPKVLFDESNSSSSFGGGWSDLFGSFIITGDHTSCWTIFTAIRYSLTPLCVCGQQSSNFHPRLVPNNPFPPYNRIGSVKKGCQVSPSRSVHLETKPEYSQEGLQI